jgi:hypothetical protein
MGIGVMEGGNTPSLRYFNTPFNPDFSVAGDFMSKG